MRCRQGIFSRSRGDLYLGGKFSKSPWGELRGPCGELYQPRQLFLCKTSYYRPEPVKSLGEKKNIHISIQKAVYKWVNGSMYAAQA